MKNKYIKRTVCIVLTLALALGGLWYIDRILRPKRPDGILTMQNLYAQRENSVDVLMVGNSHVGINVDTATLWDEYGIAAYDLWGGVQPMWNSYYYLAEALKTQTPKLVILEVTAAISDYEYSEQSIQIKNTAGMKFSKNKLEAVKISAPEGERLNLLLGLPLYHGRFDELDTEDFKNFPWSAGLENYKGSTLRYGVGSYCFESAEGVTESKEIMDKEREYLVKFIELCRERDIPVMLLKSPALERREPQKVYNTVAELAAEYGIPFINMNLMDEELGIGPEDYSKDRHMNGDGARKVSGYLGAYIRENYDVPDRRGQAGYESWTVNAAQVNDDYLMLIDKSSDYFRELAINGRSVLIVKKEAWEDNEDYLELLDMLEGIGADKELISRSSNSAWLVSDSSGGEMLSSDDGHFNLDGRELVVSFEYQNVQYDGKKVMQFDPYDLCILAYDNVTHEIVDTAAFMRDMSYELYRPGD
ncbi:MAG: hypothetical protein ACOX68_01800 [Candidatus Limivicinus sp.]|jgi:hypothetical protein